MCVSVLPPVSISEHIRTAVAFCFLPAGGGGARKAAGPGPRPGRSREEQHVAGLNAGGVGG